MIEALRALPSLEAKLASLVEKFDAKLLEPPNPHGSAVWQIVTFDGDRGLGSAERAIRWGRLTLLRVRA